MRTFHIHDKSIGPGSPVFVIAEAGVNHNGDPELARQLVTAAAEAGADAIKFQTYSADRLTTKDAPKYYVDTMEQWCCGEQPSGFQFDEFSQLDHLPVEAYREIVKLSRDLGIVFLSTPFDEESVDFLDALEVPAFKIASGDITSHRFLRYVASKKKPLVLSTGCCTLGEIEEALDHIFSTGNTQVALLHCTLSYPARVADANLNMMKTMQAAFPRCPIGLSDHTLGTLVPVLAASHGACIIEKHFTLDKTLSTSTDHFMSVDPAELKQMVSDVRSAVEAMGRREKGPVPAEADAHRYARRSLVARTAISKGQRITAEHLCIKRPGTGLPPRLFDVIVGRTAAVDIAGDTVLTWDLLA